MDFQEAVSKTAKYKATAVTIHATSDGSIYINGDIDTIEKAASEKKLEVFYIKPTKDSKPKKKKK